MADITENYNFWKNLVGLPAWFPELKPLEDDDLQARMVIQEDIEKKIINSISSKPLTAVITGVGNGLTTLFRYILKICEDKNVDSLTIPIGISVDENTAMTSNHLEFLVKKKVIQILLYNSWEAKLEDAHYYHCINYQEDKQFYTHKTEMRRLLEEKINTEKQLNARFPFSQKTLDEFINYLLEKMRLQTVILFHFPRELSEETVNGYIKAIKILQQQNTFLDAAYREVYFCTPKMRNLITRDFKRAFYDIDYPEYTAAQIFAMLVKRYRPQLPSYKGRAESLSLGEVFSQEFIQVCRIEHEPLATTMNRVNKLIKSSLDCEKKYIPFKLELTPQAMKIIKEEIKTVEAHPVLGRFRRRRGASKL